MRPEHKRLCKRCGQCCQGFFLEHPPGDLTQEYTDLFEYLGHDTEREKEVGHASHKYRCKKYEDGKGCGIEDRKPSVCDEFPFYEGQPVLRYALPAGCGYEVMLNKEGAESDPATS